MDLRHSPSGAVEIDTDRFPIVLQRIGRALRDDDVDWMIGRFDQLLDSEQRYALIVWATGGFESALTPVQRQRIARWEEAVAAKSKVTNVCTAIVLRSRIQRSFFTAYRWLAAPVTPQMVFTTIAEAEQWASDMLGSEGLLCAPSRASAAAVSGTSSPPPA